MQVSGTSSNSAAAALRALFQQQPNTGQQTAGAGQSLPSSSPAAAALTGMTGPQMSSGTMQGFISLQSQPPSTSDVATQLINSLDTNGDGVVSLQEAEAANPNAAQAFQTLDTNGDGSLSSDEVSSALQQAGKAHHGGHHHHAHGAGGSGSSADAANSLMQALDTDGDDSLNLNEVTTAVGGDASSTAIQRGFSALDTDGNGSISLSELTSAINSYTQARNTQMASTLNTSATI